MALIPRAAITAALVSTAATPLAFAGTFHVDPSGSDGASGSATAPWRTLQHAAGEVGPGDVVEVAAGTYAGFDLRRSGTEDAPIHFRAADGVLIDAPNSKTDDGINLEGASFVIIEGFEVRGVPRAGIRAVLCEDVVIIDNVTDDNGRWGIFSGFCDDLRIEGNETSRSGSEHGIYTSNSGDRPVIRNNVVWGNRAAGIHMNGDASAGGDGIITGAVVEGNVIFGNGDGGGAAINADGVQDSVFRQNLIYDNYATGIALFKIDGAEGAKNNALINNTIVMPGNNRWAVRIRGGSTGTTIVNNILHNGHSYRGSIDIDSSSLPGLMSDHNVAGRFTIDDASTILDLQEWRSATGQGGGSLVATPGDLFVDAGSGDFHMLASSPAIDAGMPELLAERDLDGNPRLVGSTVDIGAFEHCNMAMCEVPDAGDPPGSGGDDDGSGGSGGSDDSPADDPGGSEAGGIGGGCSAGGASASNLGVVFVLLFAAMSIAARAPRRRRQRQR